MTPLKLSGLAGAVLFAAVAVASPASAAGEGGGEGEDVRFVLMEPLRVTVFEQGGPRGRLTLELQLDVLHPGTSAEVQKRLPRLYDRFLNAIADYTSTQGAGNQPPDLDFLLEQFQTMADEALGADIVHVLVRLAMRML
ncbi:MAG: hypothetical protein O2905_08470 [Proteobacteria bacterium]|nr:hypothetical protein [Pseudomonadota bacterium]